MQRDAPSHDIRAYHMTITGNPISRRNMLAAAAIGGTLTATTWAKAETSNQVPEPRRPGGGGSNPGPKNPDRIRQNPDMIAPPATDHGTLPNLRFSFDDSHTRIEPGGWTRQVTVRELGISKNIASVNMRLNAGGVRELHWQAVDTRSYYETEYRIRRADGIYVWHQARGIPILEADGSVREWFGICAIAQRTTQPGFG
jgi:hypothetical protein